MAESSDFERELKRRLEQPRTFPQAEAGWEKLSAQLDAPGGGSPPAAGGSGALPWYGWLAVALLPLLLGLWGWEHWRLTQLQAQWQQVQLIAIQPDTVYRYDTIYVAQAAESGRSARPPQVALSRQPSSPGRRTARASVATATAASQAGRSTQTKAVAGTAAALAFSPDDATRPASSLAAGSAAAPPPARATLRPLSGPMPPALHLEPQAPDRSTEATPPAYPPYRASTWAQVQARLHGWVPRQGPQLSLALGYPLALVADPDDQDLSLGSAAGLWLSQGWDDRWQWRLGLTYQWWYLDLKDDSDPDDFPAMDWPLNDENEVETDRVEISQHFWQIGLGLRYTAQPAHTLRPYVGAGWLLRQQPRARFSFYADEEEEETLILSWPGQTPRWWAGFGYVEAGAQYALGDRWHLGLGLIGEGGSAPGSYPFERWPVLRGQAELMYRW